MKAEERGQAFPQRSFMLPLVVLRKPFLLAFSNMFGHERDGSSGVFRLPLPESPDADHGFCERSASWPSGEWRRF